MKSGCEESGDFKAIGEFLTDEWPHLMDRLTDHLEKEEL